MIKRLAGVRALAVGLWAAVHLGLAGAQTQPEMTWVYGGDMIKFLRYTSGMVTPIGSGTVKQTLTPRGTYASLSVIMPLVAPAGLLQRPELTPPAGGVSALGGVRWDYVTDEWTVDHAASVFADLIIDPTQREVSVAYRGDALRVSTRLVMWTFDDIAVTLDAGGGGRTQISALHLTEPGRQLMDAELIPGVKDWLASAGLPWGSAAGIGDWGVISLNVPLSVAASAVPEPASGALWVLGGLALVWGQRLRRSAA